jgi:CheY-like chemotaxis protein
MHTILVQDDPILFRDLEGSLLRREELRLLTAGSPEALLECSRREHPDLVVLRDDRPGEHPQSVVRALNALPDPPAWILSPPVPDREALLAGIRDHLGLPERQARRRRCRVRVRSMVGAEERTGITRDLAEGGSFVAMNDPFEPSREVRLALRGQGMRRAIRLGGRVVRAVRPTSGSERLPGMAIRFHTDDRLTPEQMKTLCRASRDPRRVW